MLSLALLYFFCLTLDSSLSTSPRNDTSLTLEASSLNGTTAEIGQNVTDHLPVCRYPDNRFGFIVLWKCPAMEPLCIIDQPFDISLVFERLRCSVGSFRVNNTVEILSAGRMLKQIESQMRNVGLPQCTLTAFYAPHCYFSSKMAPYLNALPRMFPRLRIVAVDASEHSKLYTRYGIVGTPTILLWVDGIPLARMDEAPFSLDSLRSFIENRTDLEAIHSVTVQEKDHEGPVLSDFESPSVDWYLLLAILAMILSIAYFFFISKYGALFTGTIEKLLRLHPAGPA